MATSKVTVETAEDVFLAARAMFEDWQGEVVKEFYAPAADTAIRLFWQQQPEQIKARLREMTPDAARRLDEMTGGA